MSPAEWAAFQHDALALFSVPAYWIMIFFLAGALGLSLIGAFMNFMDTRFG